MANIEMANIEKLFCDIFCPRSGGEHTLLQGDNHFFKAETTSLICTSNRMYKIKVSKTVTNKTRFTFRSGPISK